MLSEADRSDGLRVNRLTGLSNPWVRIRSPSNHTEHNEFSFISHASKLSANKITLKLLFYSILILIATASNYHRECDSEEKMLVVLLLLFVSILSLFLFKFVTAYGISYFTLSSSVIYYLEALSNLCLYYT